MSIIFIPRTFGGTLILNTTPPAPLTSGPVVTLLTDQLVNVAQTTPDEKSTATAILTEKVV